MNIISNIIRNPVIQKYVGAYAVGVLATPAFTYIHECGHAAAMKILWQNAHPKITLHHFGFSGATSCGFTGAPELSSLGRVFGDNASNFMVSAAGAIAQVTAAIALTALFKHNYWSYPVSS
jgi:hypothetical protein